MTTAKPISLEAVQQPRAMGPARNDPFDWLRTTKDEWIKGELLGLRDDVVSFDSEEFDEVTIDWADVAEIRSPRVHTILLEQQKYHTGRIEIVGDKLRLLGDDPRELGRRSLLAIVPGDGSSWASRWSGDLSLGLTLRSGNTEQADLSTTMFVRRETAATRWDTQYQLNASSADGVQTANSHRANSRFDVFLSRRLFVSPVGLIYQRDPFQNLRYRLSPYTSIGYHVVDAKDFDLEIKGGPGVEYTEFDSVEPGEDSSTRRGAAVLGASLEWDITKDVDFELVYQVTVPVPETKQYTHNLQLDLSIDVTSDLDLDIRFIWDRINQPIADSAGNVPEPDDYRTVIGISYQF